MLIDVLHGEAPLVPAAAAGRVVVVIDVLRAATTVATALANGALSVLPFESVDEVVAQAKLYSRNDVVLAGERKMQPIQGFDIGNSPLEVTSSVVCGKTILFTTTNGTRTLNAARGARACFFAGFVNVQATVDGVKSAVGNEERDGGNSRAREVLVVCSGTDGDSSLEDVVCAGRIVRCLAEKGNVVRSDSARIAELAERQFMGGVSSLAHLAQHALRLDAAGFAEDVQACLTLDKYDRAVQYSNHRLIHNDLLQG